MTANFLRFCRAGSVDGMTFAVGVSSVECAAGEGGMCTGSRQGSGLLVAWAMGFWGLFPCFLSITFLTNQGEGFFFSPP